MNMNEVIARINELAAKNKTGGPPPEETAERDKLRRVYIDSVKGNLVGQLENTYVVGLDGVKRKVTTEIGKDVLAMELQTQKHRSETILLFFSGVCILAYLTVFTVINCFGFSLFCDSDMYSDTLLAKLMWEQKTLFPENWIFGNQLYVIATPAWAALFYGITQNTNSAMILATQWMGLCIILSCLWLLRGTDISRSARLLGCLLLIAAVIAPSGIYSENAQLFFLLASYYACYLITMLVVFGDYVRTLHTCELRPASFSIALFLSFASGMQSLRQTVVMVLPILACEIFRQIRRHFFLKAPPTSRSRMGLLRTFSYGAANVSGYILTSCLNISQATIFGEISLIPPQEYPQRIQLAWDAFLSISGLQDILSGNCSAFYSVYALLLAVMVLAAAILWFARIDKEETPLELCWMLSVVGLFGVCLSSIVLDIDIRSIYLFPWYPLVAFSGILLFQRLSAQPKTILALSICLLSLFNLYHSYLPAAEQALQNHPSYAGKAFRLLRNYGYHSYAYTDERHTNSQTLCQWALDEGYQYIYGNWENVPHIAVHSGGQLVAGFWYPTDNLYNILHIINIQNIYDAPANEKALYLFTARDEAQGLSLAAERGAVLTKAAQFGDYRVYTSSIPLMEH